MQHIVRTKHLGCCECCVRPKHVRSNIQRMHRRTVTAQNHHRKTTKNHSIYSKMTCNMFEQFMSRYPIIFVTHTYTHTQNRERVPVPRRWPKQSNTCIGCGHRELRRTGGVQPGGCVGMCEAGKPGWLDTQKQQGRHSGVMFVYLCLPCCSHVLGRFLCMAFPNNSISQHFTTAQVSNQSAARTFFGPPQ